MIEFVQYAALWFEAQSVFATRMWNKKVRSDTDYVRWKFTRHDGGNGYSLFLAVKDGEVIGQIGAITCMIKSGGVVFRAAWWCDIMMDPIYRGKGVSKGLYRKLIDTLDCVMLGSDPSPAAEKSMKRIGFQDVSSTGKYLLPVNIPGFLRLKFSFIPSNIRFQNVWYLWQNRNIASPYRQTTLDDLTDEFLQSIVPTNPKDVFQVQTIETLKWRLKQRPLYQFKYRIYADKVNKECFVIYKSGGQICFCPVNNSRLNLKAALKHAFDFCIAEQLHYIQLRIPSEIVDKPTKRFLVKSNHSTQVLGLNHESAGIPRFSYSQLDSDESI